MTDVLSGIRLYDYEGRYRVAPAANPNGQYQTAQTDYTQSFQVNGATSPAETNRIMQSNLAMDRFGQIKETPWAALETLLNFGNNAYSTNTNQTVDGVTNPYRDYIASLSISDQNMSDLLQQDQFTVFNGKVGIKVETDGSGNIDSVSLEPGSKNLRNGTPANATTFPNRSEITERAASIEGNRLLPTSGLTPDTTQPLFKPGKLGQNKQVNPFIRPIEPTNKSLEANFQVNPARPSTASQDVSANDLLQNLFRRQPVEVGTPVVGIDSQFSPDMAKQLGAVKASFGVNYSDALKDNLVLLKDRLAQEAQAALPRKITQARDGYIPVTPFLPAEHSGGQGIFNTGGNGLNQLATSADSTEKKSAGGYIPFRMGSQGQSTGEGEQHRRRREPLYALA